MSNLIFSPPVIAHRGASGYAPENTLIAFIKAAQLGIKWVEFDVLPAACGTPVVFHDDELTRTTDGQGLVTEYSYQYLQTLDAGGWFNSAFSCERIPSLEQILMFLCQSKVSANIEIKSPIADEEGFIKEVVALVKHYTPNLRQILFSSFSITALAHLERYAKDYFLGVLLHEWVPDWLALCKDYSAASIHVNHEILGREEARQIKEIGKKLACYTVNDPVRAMELFNYGVDAVFSDVPDKILLYCSYPQ